MTVVTLPFGNSRRVHANNLRQLALTKTRAFAQEPDFISRQQAVLLKDRHRNQHMQSFYVRDLRYLGPAFAFKHGNVSELDGVQTALCVLICSALPAHVSVAVEALAHLFNHFSPAM